MVASCNNCLTIPHTYYIIYNNLNVILQGVGNRMEKSTLYDVLSMGVLQKWGNNEEEIDNCFMQREKELIEELKTELNEKSKDLLTSYSLAIEDRMDYLHYCLNVKILNLGIKIGMELEKAFLEHEEQ